METPWTLRQPGTPPPHVFDAFLFAGETELLLESSDDDADDDDDDELAEEGSRAPFRIAT